MSGLSLKPFTAPARTMTLGAFLSAAALTGCGDASQPVAPVQSLSAIKAWDASSSIDWNQTARQLVTARNVTAPIAQVRIFAYLSVAQYNAIVIAEDGKNGGEHASPAAASAAASLVVLKMFFPLDTVFLNNKLVTQRTAPSWPGEKTKDFAAGETIGRAVGAQVRAYALSDNTGLATLPVNPGGPGNWTGTNPIRGLYGTRTFVLTSGDQFRPLPPPAYGSAEFNAALAEIRAISDGPLTSAQLALAQLWAPRGPAYMNSVAAEMIVSHHKSEREGARILALANMAAFDVSNACFDAKFAYYLIRPSQADAAIGLPIGLPNHPSYPSGHSCITSAYATVLASMLPDETTRLNGMVTDAGLSRNYAGLHYFFDCAVGQELGRNVANYVLLMAGKRHEAIPLD